jgi:hypothetical protein
MSAPPRARVSAHVGWRYIAQSCPSGEALNSFALSVAHSREDEERVDENLHATLLSHEII